jgi:signal transduction histidine kinase
MTLYALGISGTYTPDSNDARQGVTTIDTWTMTVRDANGNTVEGYPATVTTPVDLHGLTPGWTVTLTAPVGLDPQSAIYLNTFYAPYRLYVNDDLIDSYGAPDTYPAFLSDPPPFNSAVSAGSPYENATMSLVYTVPRNYWGLRLTSVETGSFDAVRVMLFSQMGFAFSFGETLIALGLVLAVLYLAVHRIERDSSIFIWLGMFCACIGMWSVGECDLASVLIKRPVTLHMMTYIGLYTLLIPLTHLTRIAIHRPNDTFPFILCRASEVFALAAIALQLAGVWQFAESLFAYYAVSITLFGLMTVYLAVSLACRRTERTPFRMYYLVVVLIFDVFLGLELANYYVWRVVPEMLFCEIGAVIFVLSLIAMSGVYLKNISEEKLDAQNMRHRIALIGKRAKAERKQNRAIITTSNEIHRQRHDFKHQLAVIRGYSEENDKSGLQAYLDEISAAIPESDQLHSYCTNFAINAVVGYYVDAARAKGVTMDVKLGLPRDLAPAQENDLASIVGNLMENAVRAAASVRAARPDDAAAASVRLRGRTANGIVSIVQDNSYTSMQRDGSGNFVSQSADGGVVGARMVACGIRQWSPGGNKLGVHFCSRRLRGAFSFPGRK